MAIFSENHNTAGTSLAVLITYLDEGPLLKHCLESLITNTELPDEILIHEDGSDSCRTHIPENLKNKIRILKGSGGQGAARNALASESKSQYIHFHDADDLFTNHWVASHKKIIRDTGPQMIFSEFERLLPDGSVIHNAAKLSKLTNMDLVDFALEINFVPLGTVVHRDLFNLSGGFKTREQMPFSEDDEFFLHCCLTSPSYAIIEKSLTQQNWRPSSQCRDDANKVRIECRIYNFKAIAGLDKKISAKHHPFLRRKAAALIYDLCSLGKIEEANEIRNLTSAFGGSDFSNSVGKMTDLLSIFLGDIHACRFRLMLKKKFGC
ncbi:MAG: glycosyltransferase [Candidatus Omnitrophica bacterium]|nr:glycosyltransferase [Candidatus Omnitrophota bacterium]